MASKNSNKISIKPMNNAAAIASTLGISANSETGEKQLADQKNNAGENSQFKEDVNSSSKSYTKSAESKGVMQPENDKTTVAKKSREVTVINAEASPQEAGQAKESVSAPVSQQLEMPLLIYIKRKFPGKELYILSLLYLQKNNRGLLQMTVGSMVTLYSSVFQDVIKDDTARRSLKRLSDAGFIKTTSIPGNNAGYIYEINDFLETESLTQAEKDEFTELLEFVKSRLRNTNT